MIGRLRRKPTMSFRRHTRDSEIEGLLNWPLGRFLPPQRRRRDLSPRRRSSYPLAGCSPAEPTSVLLDNGKLILESQRVKPPQALMEPFSQTTGRLFHLRQRMPAPEKSRRLFSLRQQVCCAPSPRQSRKRIVPSARAPDLFVQTPSGMGGA